MDFVGRWSTKTEIALRVLVLWLGLSLSKFYDWRKRYGKVNEHNACIPRDHWLTDAEKQAILDYERQYPLEGYRRLTFMMLDDDVAAASPATVYRVLKSADRLQRPSPSNDRKGKGFHQPSRAPSLAHRLQSPEHLRHLLPYLQHHRRLQPLRGALGNPRDDVHPGRGNCGATGAGEVPRRKSADDLRQRTTIRRQGLQAVHPPLRHDPRHDLALLSAEQRQEESAGSAR